MIYVVCNGGFVAYYGILAHIYVDNECIMFKNLGHLCLGMAEVVLAMVDMAMTMTMISWYQMWSSVY